MSGINPLSGIDCNIQKFILDFFNLISFRLQMEVKEGSTYSPLPI